MCCGVQTGQQHILQCLGQSFSTSKGFDIDLLKLNSVLLFLENSSLPNESEIDGETTETDQESTDSIVDK